MPERHAIEIEDGQRVVADHHKADTEAGVETDADEDLWIVFCHGFVSDRTGSYEYRAERATTEGFDAVRFDFRGCGDSDGAFREQTLTSKLADLRGVLEYFDPPAIVLFGSSFGAKVAFHAAADERLEAIVGRAPVTYNRTFDDTRETVAEEGGVALTERHTIDHRFFDDLDRHPFSDAVSAVDVPVCLFHGGGDDSVPVGDSFEAAETLARRTDVCLQILRDEGHRFSRGAEDRMQDQLFEWLAASGLHPRRSRNYG